MKRSHKLICWINIGRVLPIYVIAILLPSKNRLYEDIEAWRTWKKINTDSIFLSFLCCMVFYKEFRNIVYKRMGKWSYIVKWMCLPLSSLYIYCNDIGGGLLVQHGFSTIITAQKIGRNVKIFQQVTIGFKEDKWPIIGDNVEICCGAKVLGGIHVGNNVVIGANAVVVKDVPDNVVMGGVPAKIIKKMILH